MAEAGFIRYDGRRKTARLAVPAETYADYLDPRSEGSERLSWEPLLTAVGAVSVVLFALPQLLLGTGATEDALALSPLLLGALCVLLGTVGMARRMGPLAGSEG
jgi:hypothetical protein